MSMLDDVKAKAKDLKEKAKEKAISGVEAVGKYMDEHPNRIVPIVTSSIAIVAGVITAIANIGTERDDLCWVQDDVTELDFHTKKALTNSDILELGERMIDGQTKGDALNEMGLLAKEKKRKGKRRE